MRWKSILAFFLCVFFLSSPALAGPGTPCNQTANPNAPLIGVVGSSITFVGTGLNVTPDFSVDILTDEPFASNIAAVILESPSGTSLSLWGGQVGPSPFAGNFPNTLMPVDSLDALLGEPLDGEWKLFVLRNVIVREDEDNVPLFNFFPSLISWGINACPQEPEPAVSGDCDGNGVVNMADYSCMRGKIGVGPADAGWAEGADMNDDGRIWYDDLRLLIRLLRGR